MTLHMQTWKQFEGTLAELIADYVREPSEETLDAMDYLMDCCKQDEAATTEGQHQESDE